MNKYLLEMYSKNILVIKGKYTLGSLSYTHKTQAKSVTLIIENACHFSYALRELSHFNKYRLTV